MAQHTFYPIEACLFDMDGTLVDSTPLVERIWTRWANRHGFDPAEVIRICHGRQSATTMRALAPNIDIDQEVADMLAEELAATEGFEAIPGVHKFLAQLPPDKWAVVTSAQRALAERRLKKSGIDEPHVFIANEDTENSKPHPEGFLSAAQALGIAPERCLVFEDSLAGLEAGRRAGMATLQIGAANPPRSQESPVRVRDYTALQIEARPLGLAITVTTLG